MNLDDRGFKHEAESLSGVVQGALLKILLDGQSLCLCPTFEFPMGYRTKSRLKNGRKYSSWGLWMLAIFFYFSVTR